MIERRATAAMSHPRHQKDAAPRSNLFSAAVGFSQRSVIAQRIEGREPRIAVAVEEDKLAAVERERREVGGRRLDERVGGMECRFVDVNFGRGGIRAEKAVGTECQQSRSESPCRDTRIVDEAGVDLRAVVILRSGECLLNGPDFSWGRCRCWP